MELNTVGVVGAGVMGSGVAQALAQSDHQVILTDLSDAILEAARDNIKKNLRFQAFFNKEKNLPPSETVMEKIRFTTDGQLLESADFIIENVTEKWPIKKEVYTQIDRICSEACVFACNTSAISITRIASATTRPKQVIGMHFMNPVPMKKVVEVIRGYHTSEQTIVKAQTLLSQMGKKAIIVNDSPGFVSNRVLMLSINEAIFLVQDQVAPAEDVDQIFKSCFEHKMGPLETADLIGLDTILYSLEVLCESYNDTKFRPCPLLRKMVDAGLHGRKSSQGFYSY